MKTSRVGVAKLIAKYEETGYISRLPGSGRPSKITAEIKAVVDERMRLDDETTACQLATLVTHGFQLFLRRVLRCRTYLKWTFRGSFYYQLIREATYLGTSVHRRHFQRRCVWTDECSV